MQMIDQVRILRHRADYESIGVATEAGVRDLRAEVESLIPAVEAAVAAKGYRLPGGGVRAGFRVGMMDDGLGALAGSLKERLGVAWE
jgi:hypothetical protein